MSFMCGFRMRFRKVRWALQTSAFIVSNLGLNFSLKTGCVYPYLYCYGCPLASAGCPIGSLQHFVAMQMIPLYLIGIISIYGLFFGRAFCGWACPFGTFHDILSKSSKRKGKPLPQTKFITLALVVFLAWITSETFFCKFCPSGSLFAAIPAPFFYKDLKLGIFFHIHILTLAVTIILALILSRFWCRYICPFGTIGTFNKISLLSIHYDASKCIQCGKCLKACPMGINRIHDIGESTDCILCARCIDECPKKALQFVTRNVTPLNHKKNPFIKRVFKGCSRLLPQNSTKICWQL
jgi:ferredoxin-type protein NapH